MAKKKTVTTQAKDQEPKQEEKQAKDQEPKQEEQQKEKQDIRKVFHQVRITGEPNSIHKRILIDGMELKGVVSATAIWAVNEAPRVFLEMVTTDLEYDDVMAVLPYIVKEEKDDADKDGGRLDAGTSDGDAVQ